MKLINYMGSNGTGKSTRTFYLVQYLKSKYDYEVIEYLVQKKGKEPKIEKIGYLFSNGWFIFGKESKNGTQWVSLDTGMISNWEARLNFIKDMNTKGNIKVLFMEGYFNNRSKIASPKNIREQTSVQSIHVLISHYDDIKDFLERTNTRTAKERGLDWAENSPGWNDNKSFVKMLELYNKEKSEDDIVKRVDINESKDYLVKTFFNENFEVQEVQEVQENKNELF